MSCVSEVSLAVITGGLFVHSVVLLLSNIWVWRLGRELRAIVNHIWQSGTSE